MSGLKFFTTHITCTLSKGDFGTDLCNQHQLLCTDIGPGLVTAVLNADVSHGAHCNFSHSLFCSLPVRQKFGHKDRILPKYERNP